MQLHTRLQRDTAGNVVGVTLTDHSGDERTLRFEELSADRRNEIMAAGICHELAGWQKSRPFMKARVAWAILYLQGQEV